MNRKNKIMKLPYTLAQPAARPLVKTGAEYQALERTASRLVAKGRPLLVRNTAPIKGECFTLYLHAAQNRNTGDVWTLATFESRTLPGHVRRVVVDPEGRTWTLFDADDRNHARAIFGSNKYRGKLWQLLQENLTQEGR